MNPKASAESADTAKEEVKEEEVVEEDVEELPDMTPNLVEFSNIPIHSFQKSYEFIQRHRDVYVPGASDALLVAAFASQREGKSKYAKQCIHQSLLLQYCDKLGPDGVGVFFKKCVRIFLIS